MIIYIITDSLRVMPNVNRYVCITYLSIFFIFLCNNIGNVFASNFNALILTENKQNIFQKNITLTLLKLERQGIIDIDISSNQNLSLKKEKYAYKMFVPHGISTATGSILIRGTKKNIHIPFELAFKEKSPTDFSIFRDMYQNHLQEKSLSCEASATADIIATLSGKSISEKNIVDLLPKSNFYNKLPLKKNNTYIWGNPQEGFVGYIDNKGDVVAKQKLMTGYGVYEEAIAQIYNSYGFKTEILTEELHNSDFTKQEHLSYLLRALKEGNMVQLWGDWCTRQEYDDGTISSKSQLTLVQARSGISAKNTCYNVDETRELTWFYKNENGELVKHIGLDGEHAFILLGWIGDIENPTHIRVWDTDTGYHSYPIGEWMRKWGKMQYRSIIIQKL